ncbi:hypothetical protein DFQ28_010235 [Apophysomyces sp. BC1034]|nr:hypothetical protein DFQ30_005773 [Apophysomyces sp. BC1015]KAG0182112.1 hypothetical protein DFQ29_005806 [Apophysomyces sp. BC1021]KAG0192059.1 hypothetical protein DFQ28_010235 [Apophysomyces sp. BC1034]
MTMFNAPKDDHIVTPLLKRDSHDIQTEEGSLSLETSRLMIRSLDNGNVLQKLTNPPYKKFRHDFWSVDHLCTNPASPLANMDLEAIFNHSTFQLLAPEQRDLLARLLPDIDTTTEDCFKTIAPSFFSRTDNPIFWNALDDWQSTLASGEPAGTLNRGGKDQGTHPTASHTDGFKDEAFESYWGELLDRDKLHNVAGDSKNITLKDMCRKGLIRENDVIVYKRNFSACKVIVSKSMTKFNVYKVVKASGTAGISIKLDDQIFEDFETPTALETKILDHHGKVTKDRRPNGNAFKSIRLIRDGKDMGRLFDIRKDGFGDIN